MTAIGTLRRTCAIATAAVAALALAAPAGAACALTPEAVAGADVAFVGTLLEVHGDSDRATFEIEEVWSGAGVSVHARSPEIATALPGMFQMPEPGAPAARYLVLARREADGLLWTGSDCEHGRYEWDPSLAEFRPNAPPAVAQGIHPLIGVVAAVAVIGIVGVLAFRRRGSQGRNR